MAKSKRKRSKPAKPAPPPPTMAELLETARRIQAKTQATLRQLIVLQEEMRIAREREDERDPA
jgi:thiamine biosynthesis lipoprotein ApbE